MYKKQETRLDSNPELKKQVEDAFQKQVDEGIIEEVKEEDPSSQKHYLPWHPVIREGHATTPVRPVMNASQKDKNGLSLNKCQEAGPNLLPDVVGLFLQFRKNPIAFICDISKMFLNIKIRGSQRDLHRFLALGRIFRQATLLFGEKASPYLAQEVVQVHASRMKEIFTLAAEAVKRALYMDDTITGTKSIQEAEALVKELIQFFKSMHMDVHKFNSNSKELLQSVEPELLEGKEVTEVLGITWDTLQDTLQVKQPKVKNTCQTKREVLGTLAGIYDLTGSVAPLTCKGKILMQVLWQLALEWDEKIPEKWQSQVDAWLQAIAFIPKIPRYLGQIQTIHIFADASEQAYAAVAYGASESGSHFVMAKSRVRPLKEGLTIPRLELQAAVLATEMHQCIQTNLGVMDTYFWTDSEIVWSWIKSDSSKYKVWTSNRIKKIQAQTEPVRWHWVPGTSNPADLPSRGIWPLTASQSKLWYQGPEFILTGCWPKQPERIEVDDEIKKTHIHATTAVPAPAPAIEFERFSNINRLLNTVSYVFRFVQRKTGARKEPPNKEEREEALQKLIEIDQKHWFEEDVERLSKTTLSKTSKIVKLNPFLDENGLLRMNGRMEDYKPIILHPQSHLTKLLVRDCHKKNMHSGVSTTLNEVRAKFWPLKGYATVKSIIHECFTCKKAHARLAGQQMATLPNWRTTPSPPFTHVGVDYAGPLYVTKTGNKKRYILLFTCGSTRALHLELTATLEKEDFLLAYSSFVSRRGVPTAFYSDNGTTFVAASKALPDVRWNFITPLSPWHGGLWERMVRSVKTPLRKVIGEARLKETELRVVLIRVEAVVNSRPLAKINDDDSVVITPAELITGRRLQQLDESPLVFSPSKRMKYIKTIHILENS